MVRRSRPRALTAIAGLVLGSLFLTACGSSTNDGTSATGSASASATASTSAPTSAAAEASMELSGTSWDLASYALPDGGVAPAVESGGTASLTFAPDGSWSGSTGCNRIAGTYVQDGSALTIAPGAMTLVGCDGPVADQEQAIVTALPLVTSFTAAESLVLRSADGGELLTYTPGLAQLAGTSWRATGINNGKEAVVSAAGTENATLTFAADGEVSGSGGCNNVMGSYTTTEPDGLSFGPLASTRMACADDVMQIEMEYLAALANVTTYQIEGDRLTLRDASGATQVTFERTS